MNLPLQLSLSVQLRDDATFENFYPGSNLAVLGVLDLESHPEELAGENAVFLYGAEGVGCSHLLQAACHKADKLQLRSIYLPMDDVVSFTPRMLDGMEELNLVCIDNVQAAAGLKEWEEALFDLYNRLRESGTRLLMAADNAPRNLNLTLPDLQSRLSWGLVFQVAPLTDDEKLKALQLRAHFRGLELSEEVGRYIIARSQREMSQLFGVLQKLDSASLRAKRKITIPFVKSVMDW
ncbi:DnaA inactivator Hda [Endozoicomonadaceae bacterium StTr2]